QKIIVELKDKVIGVSAGASTAELMLGAGTASPLFDEATAAMVMLGFSKAATEKVLRPLIKANPAASVEELIRLALKQM
ncbi:MAG: Holliday junction branch migration protein RuvA, partial [Rikenellaceae bacterium]|nr:Holliday junction branch migration protein RuvA [Rikenellaceae bacterium]